ncbi:MULTISPECIES: FAD-dependent monooxygenase [unclassified Mesorhizobium]|uniref:FAD-dependent monooxygenase n=1 Tax=unclassified Mesorhizobium TaxID=325217 RepID=UPI0030148177
MDISHSGKIVVAGAGIAGLTAALAFVRSGFAVDVFERSEKLEEAGAGIQLSPNATRILDNLGVLEFLLPKAVQPEAVILRDAKTLKALARVPLGAMAQKRWGAPYIVAHRADLQAALLDAAKRQPLIQLITNATVRSATSQDGLASVAVEQSGTVDRTTAFLAVGADGVWSALRDGASAKSRFTGELAWRTMIDSKSPQGRAFAEISAADCVNAFLHPGFHLIAYPVRGGAAFNIVAFTPGKRIAESWAGAADASILKQAMRNTAPALARLADEAGPWTAWPIHTVDPKAPWTAPASALIGDAAHAMTPFAAQGAAMAIEDAETLAAFVAATPDDLPAALAAWEASRRPRIEKVARRGAFNHFAWHAKGPVAVARNLVLRTRSPEKLAADLDWLYGWKPPGR